MLKLSLSLNYEIGRNIIISIVDFYAFNLKNSQMLASGGERLGIYFLETGAVSRGSKVVYDRAHSSISTIKAEPTEIFILCMSHIANIAC